MCLDYALMAEGKDSTVVEEVRDGAKLAREMEIIGNLASIAVLLVAIFFILGYKRIRTVLNRIHVHFLISLLLVIGLRLYLMLKMVQMESEENQQDSTTTTCTPSVLFLTEYLRMVPMAWLFLQGFHIGCPLNCGRRATWALEYALGAYGLSLVTPLIWLVGTEPDLCSFYRLTSAYLLCLAIPKFVFSALCLIEAFCASAKCCNSGSFEEKPNDRRKSATALTAAAIILTGVEICHQISVNEITTVNNVTLILGINYGTTLLFSFKGVIIGIIYCFFTVRNTSTTNLEITAENQHLFMDKVIF